MRKKAEEIMRIDALDEEEFGEEGKEEEVEAPKKTKPLKHTPAEIIASLQEDLEMSNMYQQRGYLLLSELKKFT